MCTPNLVIISIKRGVLLREVHHGDRLFIEHDGEIIANTLPGDVDATIGTEGRGKRMISWAKRNLKQMKYVHDFVAKVIEVKAVDTDGNALHAAYSAEMSFTEFLDFVEENDIDNLNLRMKCFVRNEEAMKKTLKSLRAEYMKTDDEN